MEGSRSGGSTGPKPGTDTPPPSQTEEPGKDIKKPDETPIKKRHDDIVEKATKSLSAFGGMNLGGSLKGLAIKVAKFWDVIGNLGDRLTNAQYASLSPKQIRKKIGAMEDKIEVPKIEKPEALATTFEIPGDEENLVDYMYRSLKIPKPKLESGKLSLQHLVKQLKQTGTLIVSEGKKAILQGFLKVGRFYKGDMVVLHDSTKKGKSGEYTAGFVVAANETSIYIRNNLKGGKPIKMPTNMLIYGIHMPG
ncbi:hypothetical protein ACFL10_02245, partial [Patescibacteria group bacterium]